MIIAATLNRKRNKLGSDNIMQQTESIVDFSRSSVLWEINQAIKYQTAQIDQAILVQTQMLNQAVGLFNPLSTACCGTFNSLDAKMCQRFAKKESLQERLYNSVFPIDPIRDWTEKEIERICKKYSWIDEI